MEARVLFKLRSTRPIRYVFFGPVCDYSSSVFVNSSCNFSIYCKLLYIIFLICLLLGFFCFVFFFLFFFCFCFLHSQICYLVQKLI